MLDPMPRVDPPLPPSTDYLRGLETGRAETQAAVVAALMQAADKPKGHADYWRKRMGQLCEEYGRDSREYADAGLIVARADLIRDEIIALIPAPAMAALEAVKAEARKVNIPTDIAAAVLKIGRVEWGATDPKSEA